MESGKSKESRRGNSRRRSGKKEDKREKRNSKSEESHYSIIDIEDRVGIVEQETPLDLENFDKGGERNNPKSSLMCPALRRQLQTHRNVLRLLHEYKLASTQINGQRILSIQPIRWSGPTPGIDCEIFVGRIPKTIYEDTLYPLFKMVGEIFQIRLMVDMAELTRGYCFIMYTNPRDAARAINQLDQYEISPGRKIRVLASVNKCKLYVGPLPWQIASEEVVRVIYASAWDIEYVSIYRFPNHDAAYAIVSFKSHRNAALARRKLRPERLFKCNEVHVEWARVDWNPSNVYEDRGTVDDKGDVQITRKYLQAKKDAFSSIPTQNDSNRYRKQLPPICPPNGNGRIANAAKSIGNCNGTRYSTMLTMSAATLDDFSSCDEKPEMITDINDNVQLDEYCNIAGDKTCPKNDADSFPNFDMWNSNLVPPLANSPTNSGSLRDHESPDKVPNGSARDWKSNVEYQPQKALSVNGYRYSNRSYYNCPSNKMTDQNQTIIADPVQYQTPFHQNLTMTPCYVLLQPQSYLYPKDVITYPRPSVVNRIRDCYDQTCASLSASSNYRSNGRADAHCGSIVTDQSFAVEKPCDCELRRDGISAKTDNDTASSRPVDLASSYVQNYTPNIMLNFTPIYTPNHVTESATSCFLFDMANGNDEKRLRPILKQTIGHPQL